MVAFTETAKHYMRKNHMTARYVMSVLESPEHTFRESSRMLWVYGYGWAIRLDLDRMEVNRIKADSGQQRHAHTAA
jgi:hypothetical protein